jgi:hypothetical protein
MRLTFLTFLRSLFIYGTGNAVSAKLSIIYEAAADYKRISVQLKNIADSRAQCDSMVGFL